MVPQANFALPALRSASVFGAAACASHEDKKPAIKASPQPVASTIPQLSSLCGKTKPSFLRKRRFKMSNALLDLPGLDFNMQ